MDYMLRIFLFGFCCFLIEAHADNEGKTWVLLVAGSNTWDNYRHQADVCHAYQIARTHGIPDERIVVMMYDDIASNKVNPTPGKMINKPGGKDVYHNVPTDYTGAAVNPSVFLKVLSGINPKTGSQKFINSTSKDNIFVYFADHGGPGLLAFPDDVLQVGDLNKTIHKIQKKKQFKKLVFYVEACESGSMFDGVLTGLKNVYAMTASNSEESSYACYYSELYDTYLGDVYSVNWLEDSDKEDLKKETIEKQFDIVRKETNTSHVTQFGDKKVAESHLSEFLGQKSGIFEEHSEESSPMDTISSRDVSLDLIFRTKNAALIKLTKAKRQFMREIFDQIYLGVQGINENDLTSIKTDKILLKHSDYSCYSQVVDGLHKNCFNLAKHSYALEFLQHFVNICHYNIKTVHVLDSINNVCKHWISTFDSIL
uniref:legumain n=1 Tax=Lepeophtheirus salmonis TaxID=72036 RepID=A0A0K2THK9_LEPSM